MLRFGEAYKLPVVALSHAIFGAFCLLVAQATGISFDFTLNPAALSASETF